VNISGISRKRVAVYGAINFGAINLLLQKMEQFYGAIIWYHLMAPFYGTCVPGLSPEGFVELEVYVGCGHLCSAVLAWRMRRMVSSAMAGMEWLMFLK